MHASRRSVRIACLTSINYAFWLAIYIATWNGLIPEPWIKPSFLVSQIFAWPIGFFCCSLWFLVNAQFHTTDWRLAVTTLGMLLNGLMWAWIIDWLLYNLRTRRWTSDARES